MRSLRCLETRFGLALAVIASCGCSDPLPEVWQLDNYRVLGVRNDPPESAPGEQVTLTLASADVRTRDVTTAWFLCDQRISALAASGGSGTSLFGGCPSNAAHFAMGPIAQFTAPPLGGGTLDDLGREAFTVIAYSCAGGSIRLPTAASHGLPTCAGTDASGRMFVRSLFVRTPSAINAPNQNPTLTAVRFGTPDAPRDLAESDRPTIARCTDSEQHAGCTAWEFSVVFDAASREAYDAPDPLGGPTQHLNERLTLAYLVSAGTLDGGFRADTAEDPQSVMRNTFYAPAAAGPVDVYVYGNDGRGGFVSAVRHLVVE